MASWNLTNDELAMYNAEWADNERARRVNRLERRAAAERARCDQLENQQQEAQGQLAPSTIFSTMAQQAQRARAAIAEFTLHQEEMKRRLRSNTLWLCQAASSQLVTDQEANDTEATDEQRNKKPREGSSSEDEEEQSSPPETDDSELPCHARDLA